MILNPIETVYLYFGIAQDRGFELVFSNYEYSYFGALFSGAHTKRSFLFTCYKLTVCLCATYILIHLKYNTLKLLYFTGKLKPIIILLIGNENNLK